MSTIFSDLEYESICQMPAATGECRRSLTRYFYNVDTKQCDLFFYGGCYGNKNNFLTQSQCIDECIKGAALTTFSTATESNEVEEKEKPLPAETEAPETTASTEGEEKVATKFTEIATTKSSTMTSTTSTLATATKTVRPTTETTASTTTIATTASRPAAKTTTITTTTTPSPTTEKATTATTIATTKMVSTTASKPIDLGN